MKKIKLTQNKLALVDDEDFERLNQFKWCVQKAGNTFYAIRNSSAVNKKQKTILMHRVIMNVKNNLSVDHKNGNGLDNLKKNLRICTHQENHFNRISPNKNNKLRTKGVYWNKKDRKFRSQIKINYEKIYLGSFNVLGDADSAYRKAEEKYFGEFVRL